MQAIVQLCVETLAESTTTRSTMNLMKEPKGQLSLKSLVFTTMMCSYTSGGS